MSERHPFNRQGVPLLSQVVVSEYWKNIASTFCATHNVMGLDIVQF